MDIGEQRRVIIVEPEPVTGPDPEPLREPDPIPAKREPEPAR